MTATGSGGGETGDGATRDGEIRKRSVVIAGHRTSVSLENAFWKAFRGIAHRRGVSPNLLIGDIDLTRKGNLSSAIRLFVLEELRRGK